MTAWNSELRTKIQTISRISSLINSSLATPEVLNNALSAVEHFIAAETSSFFELDRGTGELFFCCARGKGAEKLTQLRLKVGEGIAGWVAQTEQPVMVADVGRDPRFQSHFDAVSGFSTRSILCVPVKAKDRLLGVLELLNKKDGSGFQEEDLNILSIVANQIGTALENARLYQKLQDKLLVTVEELKFTQGKLLQSERLAALGKLAQGVAHEVRNPVAIIGGLAHLLEKRIPAGDRGQKFLGEINEAVQRLERMVEEIEAFARMPKPRLRPSDLAGVIHQALAGLAAPINALGISVEMHLAPELPPVPVDPHLLGRVLQLLIENALEAMPKGGKLSFATALEGRQVKITLQDTGTGIAPETLPLVFDPFFSTKPSGTGMGLTMAHRIISEHHGDIQIRSTPGGGTAVDLRLPRWPAD